MILLLNFVIAILGTTYGVFDEIKTGLYYNTLNQMSALVEWDDNYGTLFCLRPPLITWVLLLPLSPFFFILKERHLKVFN